MKPAVNSIRPHDSFRGRGLGAAGAGEEVQRSKVECIQRGNDGDAVHPVAEAPDEEPKDEEKIEALAEEEGTCRAYASDAVSAQPQRVLGPLCDRLSLPILVLTLRRRTWTRVRTSMQAVRAQQMSHSLI